MKAQFSADQAAQRLLALIDTLGVNGDASAGKRMSNANQVSKAPDASSISWAFHDTIDTTGALRWLAENIDAASNGLSDDELELLSHLERTEFQYDDSSNLTKHQSNSTREGDEDVMPSFELRARKKEAQARVTRLEAYAETVRGQRTLLKSRVNQMTHELEELQAEELALTKAASSADGDVARLTSMYTGLLGESSLAAQTLMTRLQSVSLDRRYFYQCASDIGRLESALQAHVEDIGEYVSAYLKSADELPSPWKEFEPFATQSVPELLRLAAMEHSRIGGSAQKLVRSTLALEIENELLRAVDAEVEKAMRVPGDLLQRCQSQSPMPSDTESGTDRALCEHVARLVSTALPDSAAPRLQPAVKSALANLNQSCNELTRSRSAQLDQELATLKTSLALPTQTISSIRHALATEGEMLSGWVKLWSTVSSGLDSENAEMERQKGELQRVTAATGNSQIIHPDDIVALSLKRLVDMSRRACDATVAPLGSAGVDSNNDEHGADADGDIDMRDHGSWPTEGAFTSWEALLADAKACCKAGLRTRQAVMDEIYALEALERRMHCSRLDLEAALHGGGPDSGTETIDILPVGVRDMMGELKHQANILRKRVTKATMAIYPTVTPVYPTIPPVYTTVPPVYPTLPPVYTTVPPVYPTVPPVYPTIPPVYTTVPPVYPTVSPVYPTVPPVYTTVPPVYTTTTPVYPTSDVYQTTTECSTSDIYKPTSTPPAYTTVPPVYTTVPHTPTIITDTFISWTSRSTKPASSTSAPWFTWTITDPFPTHTFPTVTNTAPTLPTISAPTIPR